MVLIRKQHLPISLHHAWEFFSDPRNLATITPPYMGFDITSDCINNKAYAGMIITYRVKPLFNVPLRWITEITHFEAPHFFVDNQKSGPFKIWHHQYIFEETPTGIKMTDIVHFSFGFGWLGRLIENLIVEKRVNEIFDYRFRKLEEIFGKQISGEN